ncbi:hypothetical protein DBV15_10957 [Temnothorax longispinosus]|uniref:THAP-type domain-containing protein n=1 Tax=Temnothorax longispinosus TaxID=300112 RepID=A0A4S2KXK7_9HYME|nr:hypothetical protein DBV15_10957 [Temnothorax longispinosus]
MGGCVAPFCNNSTAKGYIMKIFPRDPQVLTKDVENDGSENNINENNINEITSIIPSNECTNEEATNDDKNTEVNTETIIINDTSEPITLSANISSITESNETLKEENDKYKKVVKKQQLQLIIMKKKLKALRFINSTLKKKRDLECGLIFDEMGITPRKCYNPATGSLIINKTEELGFHVNFITSDMGSGNTGLWKLLGISANRFKLEHFKELINIQENSGLLLTPKFNMDDLKCNNYMKIKVTKAKKMFDYDVGCTFELVADENNKPEFIITAWFTTREVIKQKFPEMEEELSEKLPFKNENWEVNAQDLKYYLNDGDETNFLKCMKDFQGEIPLWMAENLLTMSAQHTFQQAVTAILKRFGGKDLNVIKAARVAAQNGHHVILGELLKVEPEMANNLILIVCAELGVPGKQGVDNTSNLLKCLELILEQNNVDVRCTDKNHVELPVAKQSGRHVECRISKQNGLLWPVFIARVRKMQ